MDSPDNHSDLQPTATVPAERDWRYRPDHRGRQLLQTVRQAVRTRQMWQPGQRVLLACSGGPDSMAALLLLDGLRRSLGHALAVALIDHGLQPDRAQAEELVREVCASRQLPLRVERVTVAAGPQLEARARQLRYQALHRLKGQLECAVIATAHHADDQAETWLMRAARGAGVPALAAIRADRGDGVVRPFLALSRADLAHVLGARPAWRDPSNSDEQHLRNRLRAQVLPSLEAAMPGAARALARTAEHLQNQALSSEIWMSLALQHPDVAVDAASGSLQLPAPLVPTHPAALGPLLQWICAQLSVPAPGTRAVEQVAAAIQQSGPVATQIAGLTAQRQRGMWTFSRADVARARPAD